MTRKTLEVLLTIVRQQQVSLNAPVEEIEAVLRARVELEAELAGQPIAPSTDSPQNG